MNEHMLAFGLGFLLDLLLGDPQWLYHPIRLIGGLISGLERWLREEEPPIEGRNPAEKEDPPIEGRNSAEKEDLAEETAYGEKSCPRKEKLLWQGRLLVIFVLTVTGGITAVLLLGAYALHPWLGTAVEGIMTWQILAIKSLKTESMKVYQSLSPEGKEEEFSSGEGKLGAEEEKGTELEAARRAVSMIVGRDTEGLDREGIIKAAVETVAENTSDGVIAPMLYTALGGPILGFLYKAVNTMDSMLGYKNERYLYFGRAAAKLDDAVNFFPARITALLMIFAAFLGGREFDANGAVRIGKRDRYNHASPNSAQTEAICAGALGIQLAGDASYFGKVVKKPYIGDPLRKVEREDIRRVNRLMYISAWLCALLCLLIQRIISF